MAVLFSTFAQIMPCDGIVSKRGNDFNNIDNSCEHLVTYAYLVLIETASDYVYLMLLKAYFQM